MVCVPCIVIPVVLWIFHKWIQPFLLKFWNPWAKSGASIESKNVDMSSKEGQFIEGKITNNPIVLFSKTTCSFCNVTKKALNELDVEYLVEEIDGREDMDKIQDLFNDMTGERTVPRVFIGGKCVGGATQTLSLKNQGKLVELMKEAKASFKKSK